MGLSTDPVKRRRQLEALASGAQSRADKLRALAAACDPDPGSSEAPIEAEEVAGIEAAIDAPSEAVRGASPAARIVPGSFSAVAPPGVVGEEELELDDDDVVDEAPPAPGLGVKLAAAALGVKR